MEVTVHGVYEITTIFNAKEEQIPAPDSKGIDDVKKKSSEYIKSSLSADNVVCTDLKYFITEKEG